MGHTKKGDNEYWSAIRKDETRAMRFGLAWLQPKGTHVEGKSTTRRCKQAAVALRGSCALERYSTWVHTPKLKVGAPCVNTRKLGGRERHNTFVSDTRHNTRPSILNGTCLDRDWPYGFR